MGSMVTTARPHARRSRLVSRARSAASARSAGRGGLLGVVLVAVGAAGCLTVRHADTFYEHDRIRVDLRHSTRMGSVVPRGFDHPAVVSARRLGHILQNIDVRGLHDERERVGAIHPELIGPIAEALSAALAAATPDQEIAVLAVRNDKNLAIFDRNYLTSFVAYREGDELAIHLARLEWEVPRDRLSRLPQPVVGQKFMSFRTVAGPGMRMLTTQSVAVDWRSDAFDEARRLRRGADGGVARRTILMESPAPPMAGDPASPDPPAAEP